MGGEGVRETFDVTGKNRKLCFFFRAYSFYILRFRLVDWGEGGGCGRIGGRRSFGLVAAL